MASFDALPVHLVELIGSHLSPIDLVKLGTASKSVSEALQGCTVWEQESRRRWPLLCFAGPGSTLQAYRSYQELFRKRMAQRSSFPDKTDLLRTVTAAARRQQQPEQQPATCGSLCPVGLRSRQSIEQLALQACQLASDLQVTVSRKPCLRHSKEFQVFVADVCWWLGEHPQVLLWAKGLPRSHLAHMLEVCSPGQVHQSITDRLRLAIA